MRRRLVLFFSLSALIATTATAAQMPQASPQASSRADGPSAGRSLRAAVLSTYEDLRRAGRLTSQGDGNDISQVVGQYIRPGMTLRDAAVLIRGAGFATTPMVDRPMLAARLQEDAEDLEGELDMPSHSVLPIFKSMAFIQVQPGGRTGGGRVAQVRASIFTAAS